MKEITDKYYQLIDWTPLKLKISALWKTMSREWEDKPQTGRKYMQRHSW